MDRKTITFRADDQVLVKLTGADTFAADIVSYIDAQFDLGNNWSGFDAVRAVWSSATDTISTVLDAEGKCVVPTEVLRYPSRVIVSLVGSTSVGNTLTDRLTTYAVVAFIIDEDTELTGSETPAITPSQFEQFAGYVKGYRDETYGFRSDAEAWAVGQRFGEDVDSDDETYHNNSKYYAEKSSDYCAQAEAKIDGFIPTVESAVDEWMTAHPEYTTTVMDGSLTESKFSNALKLKAIKDYVTPEMFGAKGDGLTDDTQAVQECIDMLSTSVVLLGNKYLITSPIVISAYNARIIGNGAILYNGDDYAIKIHGTVNTDIELDKIVAPNGGGILFYSQNANDFNQYINLYIGEIIADSRCISMNKISGQGWSNEIRIHNVRFSGDEDTTIGLYLKGPITNGWSLTNVGFEGLKTGVYMDGDDIDVACINTRSAESLTYIAESNGKANILLIDQHRYTRPAQFNLSSNTRGSIFGIICTDQFEMVSSHAVITKGIIIPQNPTKKTWNYYSAGSYDIADSDAKYFTLMKIGINPVEIKLSPLYGKISGINEFEVRVNTTSPSSLKLTDENGDLIYNFTKMIPSSSYYFKYNGTSWDYEIQQSEDAVVETLATALSYTDCAQEGYTHNGYKTKGNLVIVNLRIKPTATSCQVAGFPKYQGNGSVVGVNCTSGWGRLSPQGVLSVFDATPNIDLWVSAVYITDAV